MEEKAGTKNLTKYIKSFLSNPIVYLSLACFVTIVLILGPPEKVTLAICVAAIYVIAFFISILYSLYENWKEFMSKLYLHPGGLKYTKIYKIIRIKNCNISTRKCDALVTIEWEGINYKEARRKLWHYYQTNGHICKEKIKGYIWSDTYGFKETEQIELKFSYINEKIEKVVVTFPLGEMEKGKPFPPHKLEVYVKDYYNIGSEDSEAHRIGFETDELNIELLIEDEGLKFLMPKFKVLDYNGDNDTEEEDRVNKKFHPNLDPSTEKKIVWTIKKPRYNDKYILYFRIIKTK